MISCWGWMTRNACHPRCHTRPAPNLPSTKHERKQGWYENARPRLTQGLQLQAGIGRKRPHLGSTVLQHMVVVRGPAVPTNQQLAVQACGKGGDQGHTLVACQERCRCQAKSA